VDEAGYPRTFVELTEWCRARIVQYADSIGRDTMCLKEDAPPEMLAGYAEYKRQMYIRVREMVSYVSRSCARLGAGSLAAAIPIEHYQTVRDCIGLLSAFVDTFDKAVKEARASSLVDALLSYEPPAISPVELPKPDSLEIQVKITRPMAERDGLWLAWYEDSNAETYHSPAKIRDRWNRDNPRRKVSSADVVKKGLDAARRDRESTGER
jgi:hypothetical protein